MPQLTEKEIQANKDLGLHEMFWETAIVVPAEPTPEWMDAHFTNWRQAGAQIAKSLHVQIYAKSEVAS